MHSFDIICCDISISHFKIRLTIVLSWPDLVYSAREVVWDPVQGNLLKLWKGLSYKTIEPTVPIPDGAWVGSWYRKYCNDFVIFFRCGRLVYHLGLPYSFLTFSHVEDSIKSVYCESKCGNCSLKVFFSIIFT